MSSSYASDFCYVFRFDCVSHSCCHSYGCRSSVCRHFYSFVSCLCCGSCSLAAGRRSCLSPGCVLDSHAALRLFVAHKTCLAPVRYCRECPWPSPSRPPGLCQCCFVSSRALHRALYHHPCPGRRLPPSPCGGPCSDPWSRLCACHRHGTSLDYSTARGRWSQAPCVQTRHGRSHSRLGEKCRRAAAPPRRETHAASLSSPFRQ
jgi:hypothetical protein